MKSKRARGLTRVIKNKKYEIYFFNRIKCLLLLYNLNYTHMELRDIIKAKLVKAHKLVEEIDYFILQYGREYLLTDDYDERKDVVDHEISELYKYKAIEEFLNSNLN